MTLLNQTNNIYKYCTFDNYSFENLEEQQLWCNNYEAFNDPYECWCIEEKGIPKADSEWSRFDNVAKAWGFTSGKDVSQEDLIEYCSEFFNERAMEVSDYVDSARISCFSNSYDNLLLWSHYANGLRGFCIEFDKDELLKNSENYTEIHKVQYNQSPPVVDTMVYEVAYDQIWYHEMVIDKEYKMQRYMKKYRFDPYLPQYQKALVEARNLLYQLYIKMLCCKPHNWKYEEEIRLILHTRSIKKNGEAFKYSKEAIKSIIVGEKADLNNISKLRSIMKKIDIDVPILFAKRNKESYKLKILVD